MTVADIGGGRGLETLAEINAKARALGLTYGEFVALTYTSHTPCLKKPACARNRRKRTFSEIVAFELWQKGKSDAEIGASLGVSRALIQRWRDTLELPSNSKPTTDPSKYKVIETPYGIYVVVK